MGREQGWSDVELEHLARAWVFTMEDSVAGVDQNADRFNSTIFENFATLALQDASANTFGVWTSKSVRAKFDDVSADMQKFRDVLRKVTSSSPTGCTETEAL